MYVCSNTTYLRLPPHRDISTATHLSSSISTLFLQPPTDMIATVAELILMGGLAVLTKVVEQHVEDTHTAKLHPSVEEAMYNNKGEFDK